MALFLFLAERAGVRGAAVRTSNTVILGNLSGDVHGSGHGSLAASSIRRAAGFGPNLYMKRSWFGQRAVREARIRESRPRHGAGTSRQVSQHLGQGLSREARIRSPISVNFAKIIFLGSYHNGLGFDMLLNFPKHVLCCGGVT